MLRNFANQTEENAFKITINSKDPWVVSKAYLGWKAGGFGFHYIDNGSNSYLKEWIEYISVTGYELLMKTK